MGRVYGEDRKKKECVLNFCGETSWETPFRRPRRRWEDNIKVDIRKTVCEDEVDDSRSGTCPLAIFWY
jgi:hypothetical protein